MVLVEISWFLLSKNSSLLAFLVLSLQQLAPFSACQRVTDSLEDLSPGWGVCGFIYRTAWLYLTQWFLTFWSRGSLIVIENAEDPKELLFIGLYPLGIYHLKFKLRNLILVNQSLHGNIN